MAAGRGLSETAWQADVKVCWKESEEKREVRGSVVHLLCIHSMKAEVVFTDMLGKVQVQSKQMTKSGLSTQQQLDLSFDLLLFRIFTAAGNSPGSLWLCIEWPWKRKIHKLKTFPAAWEQTLPQMKNATNCSFILQSSCTFNSPTALCFRHWRKVADIQEIQEYLWKSLVFHNYSLTKQTKQKQIAMCVQSSGPELHDFFFCSWWLDFV